MGGALQGAFSGGKQAGALGRRQHWADAGQRQRAPAEQGVGGHGTLPHLAGVGAQGSGTRFFTAGTVRR